ncbi:hypothetical protein BD413DRAFT_465915 [Trametes elegans]|nr:hypothetical protein BD413DRAFT_465915 [Trametes elegans]
MNHAAIVPFNRPASQLPPTTCELLDHCSHVLSASSHVFQHYADYTTTSQATLTSTPISFKSALADNLVEFEEYNIHSFEDYLRYLESFFKWVPCENKDANAIYDRVCLFYYVFNKPPVNRWQTQIDPSSHPPWTWLSQWCIDYAREIGKAMNAPGSLSPETLQTFYDCEAYHMEDYIVPPRGWRTFNEFFTRRIKPEVRPIDASDEPSLIVSPTDSTPSGAWPVDARGTTTFTAKDVRKGEEIGYFQMGGSDIVMVFQCQAHVQFIVEEGQWRPPGREIARAQRHLP